MGVGRRMQKQGMPMTLEELGIDRKRKPQTSHNAPVKKRRKSEDDEPKKFVNLNRAIRLEREEKAVKKEQKKKQKLVNPDAQITISPALPILIDDAIPDDDDEEELVLKEAEVSEQSISEDEEEEIDEIPLEDLENASEETSASDSVFDSQDEDQQPKRIFSEDEEDSEGMEELNAANIESLSRKLDREQAQIDTEAQQELEEDALQTNIAPEDGLAGDMEQQTNLAPDLQFLRSRMTETIRILGNFTKLADKTKSRAEYTQLLLSDICAYYGYTTYLAEKLFSLFSPSEAFAFFEANETPRPVVLRTNTLRTNRRTLAQALINRGVVLEPVGKWSKVGLQVFEAPVPLGATPEYLAGHYILQAASSFLPVMALAPQPNERVLDMAAAPGGKTTYISALMRNTGGVFANDPNRRRAKGLIGNVHRLGCKNVIVCNYEAQKAFPKILGGFDRVLLDAPCSGTGVIGKDPSVKTSKNERDFLALPHMQKQLLLAAIDSVDHHSKTGGYIVYSTCSVTVEENEGVVQYVLRKRPNVKIVETGLGSFGSEGFTSYMGKKFDARMNMTRRYFPHRENVDGFFVCKLKKTGPGPKDSGAKVNGNANQDGQSNTISGGTDTEISEAFNEIGGIDNEQDDFGGFDDEQDQEIIDRAEKKWLRARGLDPNAAHGKKNTKQKEKASGSSATSESKKPKAELKNTHFSSDSADRADGKSFTTKSKPNESAKTATVSKATGSSMNKTKSASAAETHVQGKKIKSKYQKQK